MAKEQKAIISDESIEKVINCFTSIARMSMEQQNEVKELERQEKNERKAIFKEEKERIKKEFNRICDLLEKTDPRSDEYRNLTRSLSNIKEIFGYSDWST